MVLTDTRIGLARRIAGTLRRLLPDECSNICLVDVPDHSNVGDQAILLGELAWIKQHSPQARVSFFDTANYSDASDVNLGKADVILLHGGGNFGTTWPHHHQLRLRILDRLTHKRIIQLPQTISFANPEAALQTQRIIDRTRNFSLLVRDHESFEFAKAKFSCSVSLAPDMAFFLDLERLGTPYSDVFSLLRTDKEKVPVHSEIEEILRATGRSFRTADWLANPLTLSGFIDRRLQTARRRIPRIVDVLMTKQVESRTRYSLSRLSYGTRLLSSGRLVVSDRLHAHILCCIMGIDHIVLDSFDRKVSRFYDTWGGAFGFAKLARGISDLPQLVTSAVERFQHD